MRAPVSTEYEFGRQVMGPIVAEFCLRLWSLASQMHDREDTAMLFCARGGLRMQTAYERSTAANELPSLMPSRSFMVSRVTAIRPALLRVATEDLHTLTPAVSEALAYEFPNASTSQVAESVTGASPRNRDRWDMPFTGPSLALLLKSPDGADIVSVLTEQVTLFSRHLRSLLGSRGHGLLVDTGLYGTTRELLAEGYPELDFGCVLMARSFRDGAAARTRRTTGLSVTARGYSPFHRRTSMLRHWHFMEWLFEPELASVQKFVDEEGVARSNLEVEGWQERVLADHESIYAGVLSYIDSLGPGSGGQVLQDADPAWIRFKQAVVWPDRGDGHLLRIGTRSHDFGRDDTWGQRAVDGPLGALRGTTMWREGEIARTGSRLRAPLLCAIEVAYTTRNAFRLLTQAASDRRPSGRTTARTLDLHAVDAS